MEAVHRPGMQPNQLYQHPMHTALTPTYMIQTPATARQGYLHTPPTVTTRALHSMNSTPATTPATSIMVTPASAISPVSPIRARFAVPMTHVPDHQIGATGEGRIARDGRMEERREMDDEEDARTEIGSPEMEMEDPGLTLPPIRTLPSFTRVAQQTRRAMRDGAAISQDVLLYGPAGVTPALAELARNNVCDKMPPIPTQLPGRQATFFGIQNVPIADGSGRFATICAPGMRPVPVPVRPVYPPSGMAPLIAGHQGLAHAGLTAPIERGDEMSDWKEQQRAKERADVVVKDGDLSAAEKSEMEKRVSMSVKVINHIYYGADDLPKTRSPTQPARRLPEERAPADDAAPGPSAVRAAKGAAYWPPTPSSMPSSPESPKTRRERQRASMRKDVLGEPAAPKREQGSRREEAVGLEEMVRSISASAVEVQEEQDQEEVDPSRDQPARTLTWFVTEVLRRSRTSINVLQVALAYLAGAKPEIHNQLRIAADRQAELAIQIAGIPQHVRDALPNMDWAGSEFTPSPLIDPRRTFLASLVLASKFLLDKAFSNKAWAKLSGLEALEVGKCERALGTALNWRLWVGREASRESITTAPNPPHFPAPTHLTLSPPAAFPHRSWDSQTLPGLRNSDSPAQSNSPYSISYTQGSTPTLTSGSEPGSESDAPHGFDDLCAWTHTPEMASESVAVADDTQHGSPSGFPSAAKSFPMHSASEPVVRPALPSIRSFDRPVLRRGPSELVTPQTDSNAGCMHMLPVHYDRVGNEAELTYAGMAPWDAISGQAHWDFGHNGVVNA